MNVMMKMTYFFVFFRMPFNCFCFLGGVSTPKISEVFPCSSKRFFKRKRKYFQDFKPNLKTSGAEIILNKILAPGYENNSLFE